jgi:hypothetical protein
MSYELAGRFWSFANDKDGRARRAVQHRPPDYTGMMRLQLMLAVLRGDIDPGDFIDDDRACLTVYGTGPGNGTATAGLGQSIANTLPSAAT